jgi:hypothetical protein
MARVTFVYIKWKFRLPVINKERNAIQCSLVGNDKCNLYYSGANRIVSQLVVCTTGAQHLHALPGQPIAPQKYHLSHSSH